MRVLVTGASGLLGREVMREIKGQAAWTVRGLYATRAGPDLVQCNLLEEDQLERQFAEFAPDVVIHTAAERRPDVVFKRPEAARNLNIGVTENMASACRRHKAWLIFISTDYIFDGTTPPYAVDAQPHPLSTYGEQKVDGENLCREQCPTCAVLRIPLMYGQMEYPKESGVTALYGELQRGISKADHLQRRYPTYTGDIAKILRKMVEVHFGGQRKLSGVYHWQSDECLTKYDMVQVIAGVMDMDASQVEASLAKPNFPVPLDTRLDCSRLEQELQIDVAKYRVSFKEAVGHCLNEYLGEDTCRSRTASCGTPCGIDLSKQKTVPTEEATRILDILGASQHLRHSVNMKIRNGVIDAKDMQILLGAQV